jgi:hypothetical protein
MCIVFGGKRPVRGEEVRSRRSLGGDVLMTGSRCLGWPGWRARLLGALAVTGLVGLAASAVTAPAASAAPARPSSADGSGQSSAPAVPVTRSFVAQPKIAAGQPDVRQACATPTAPGQMACMALISTRPAILARAAAVRADASSPGGPAFDPAQLQDAYGLTSAAAAGPPTVPRTASAPAVSPADA